MRSHLPFGLCPYSSLRLALSGEIQKREHGCSAARRIASHAVRPCWHTLKNARVNSMALCWSKSRFT